MLVAALVVRNIGVVHMVDNIFNRMASILINIYFEINADMVRCIRMGAGNDTDIYAWI